MTINLLPLEFKPKGYLSVFSKGLKKFAVIGSTLFVFTALLSFIILIFYSQATKSSLKKQEDLKKQIEALTQTEQKLVLLRDRIENIQKIRNFDTLNSQISSAEALFLAFPQLSIESVTLEKESSKITFLSTNLSDLTSLLQSSEFSENRRIIVSHFDFDPERGYALEVELVNN